MILWTTEKVREYDNDGVRNLRNNALAHGEEEIAALCDEVLLERKVIKTKPKRHIVELHYICHNNLNVTEADNGRVRSGNWILAKEHCDLVVKNGVMLALYRNKKEKSFLQGKIVDWDPAPEEPGQHRAKFTIEPTPEALEWVGEATGERGYKWSDSQ